MLGAVAFELSKQTLKKRSRHVTLFCEIQENVLASVSDISSEIICKL